MCCRVLVMKAFLLNGVTRCKNIKNLGLCLACLLSVNCWVNVHAADFVVGNISYDVVSMSDLTCEVAVGTQHVNTVLEIPATVTFKNRTFTVIGVGDWACKEKGISRLILPEGLQYIGERAFESNALSKIVIPSTVTTIKPMAFRWNNVTAEQVGIAKWRTVYLPIELILEDSNEELVGYKDELYNWMPFKDCNLEKIYIGRNINKELISDQIVSYTKEIEIGDNVKELTTSHIKYNPFSHFSALQKVVIGKGLRTVPYFDEVDVLREVYVKSATPQYSEGFNDATYLNGVLYVPKGSKSVYEQTEPWSNFWEIQEWEPTGIDNIVTDQQYENAPSFNLSGRIIDKSYKGITVKKGKKYIKR